MEGLERVAHGFRRILDPPVLRGDAGVEGIGSLSVFTEPFHKSPHERSPWPTLSPQIPSHPLRLKLLAPLGLLDCGCADVA
jgi:hypothetical protein